jgi:hypothetical protein
MLKFLNEVLRNRPFEILLTAPSFIGFLICLKNPELSVFRR